MKILKIKGDNTDSCGILEASSSHDVEQQLPSNPFVLGSVQKKETEPLLPPQIDSLEGYHGQYPSKVDIPIVKTDSKAV